jgi:hypothetical protein
MKSSGVCARAVAITSLAAFTQAVSAGPLAWDAEAGVGHRTLSEFSPTGSRLVKESGPIEQLRLTARSTLAAPGEFAVSLRLAQAQMDYAGQTQAGQSLATTTRHGEVEGDLRWRPWPGSPWTDWSLGLDLLRLRRAIASSLVAGGITETSTYVMPAIGWRSPSWEPGPLGARLQVEAGWRASVHSHLNVDYGGVLDNSSLQNGRRNDLSLRGTAQVARWTWSLAWRRSRQSASESVPLYRAGTLVGAVNEPRIAIDDWILSVGLSF